jgi:hypothetical protein
MWLTGRLSGAATVFVLEPSQVTGLVETAGTFASGVRVGAPAASDEFVEPEVPEVAEESGESEAVAVVVVSAEEETLEEGLLLTALPSSWVAAPSPHAVRDSAARTVVAAAATRRVREVRRSDMLLSPLGVRVAVVIG